MDTSTFLTTIVTAMVLLIAGLVYASGFLLGKKLGRAKGYDQAIKDLLLTKNPEAWEMARTLQIDLLEQLKTEKLQKLRSQNATTALERKG